MSLSKNINPNLVLVQPRKTCPFITERLLMGPKESNQTNKQNGLYEKSHTISRKRRLVHNSRLKCSRCILPKKIFKHHRKYLRFSFKCKVFQFRVLSFGPTVAPRVFSKVTSVVAAYLRQQSIRLATYLDDWLVLNQITMEKSIHRSKFRLGFMINKEKSNLLPSQDLTYIGGHFLLAEGLVFPTLERVQGMRVSVQHLLQSYNTARDYLVLLRKDSILSRNGSKCKIVHTPNPNAFVTKLESNKNVYGLPNSCYTMAKATFEMVVTRSNCLKGSVSSTNSVYRDSDDRYKSGWLGSSHEQSYSPGSLVKCAENVSHQLSRDGGNISDSERFF